MRSSSCLQAQDLTGHNHVEADPHATQEATGSGGTDISRVWFADCIRQDFASLAEHAYPEAYCEFKHSMLLLIFAEDLENSPVKAHWSVKARSDLAGMLCRTLKQHAGKSKLVKHLRTRDQTDRSTTQQVTES